MLSFMQNHKLEEANPDAPKGGGTPESKEPPKSKAGDAKAEGDGDNLDELGYEKVKPEEGEKSKAGDSKKKDPVEEKIENPATGYGDEPPKVEEPKADDKEEEAAPEPDEFDKALEALPKEEASKIKDFAKKHNVSIEVAKAFGELRKSEIEEAKAHFEKRQKELEQEQLRMRAAWHKELKEDPAFGGEKFKQSILAAEKVLGEFMPETKKLLTERKGVLPPYVMRDLASMAKHLYATEKLVQGDPNTPKADEKEKDDALDFYNS